MGVDGERSGDLQGASYDTEGVGWLRKRDRLPQDRYIGTNAYFVTTATWQRHPYFLDRELVGECEAVLISSSAEESMSVLACVFMPDHLHLLLHGDEGSNLARFMKRFKQKTGFDFKKMTGQMPWQKSFYDRVVRKDEDLNDLARYVAANPVRAGLCEDWRDYPHTAGMLLTREADGDLKVATTSIFSEEAPI